MLYIWLERKWFFGGLLQKWIRGTVKKKQWDVLLQIAKKSF